ncbi:MAG: hypothetical protein QXG09_04660 [Candidatus Bathyarchaeia archaeon]
MNNSNSDSKNRSIRRKEDKAKRKTLIRLIGKDRIDSRSYQNLKAVFRFIGNREEFTGPQIRKNTGIRDSVLYDLLDSLKSRGLIEEAGSFKSPGRGETIVYRLTLAGKIVASYVNNDARLLTSALREVAEREANPLKQFFIEAFLENYPGELMREILEISISTIKDLEEGFDVDDLLSYVFEEAFIMMPFIEMDKELEAVFRKNAELMEKSPHRDWIFTYLKMQLESNFLYILEGEKLAKYAESLKLNPQLLHIPCENPECTNVIMVDSLLKMSIPTYCGKCKAKEGANND